MRVNFPVERDAASAGNFGGRDKSEEYEKMSAHVIGISWV